MIKECRNCRHSTVHEYDHNWKVVQWYCPVFKKVIPAYIHTTNCGWFDSYESNLHDNDAARPSPQTRDNGIHQKE